MKTPSIPLMVIVTVLGCFGCAVKSPLGPSAQSTPASGAPAAVTIWKDGVSGQVGGQTFAVTANGSGGAGLPGSADSVQTATDTLNGDQTTLQLAAPGDTYVAVQFSVSAPVDLSAYYASGHLQYDCMVGTMNPTDFTVFVTPGDCTQYPAPVGSQGVFTHVSIPWANGHPETGCSQDNSGQAFTGIGFDLNTVSGAVFPEYSTTSNAVYFLDNIYISSN